MASSKEECKNGSDVPTSEQLQSRIYALEEELRICKEMYGFEGNMTLEEMKDHKELCEDAEQVAREADPEYDEHCTRVETLEDLVVSLGEQQFAVSQLYGQMRKLSDDESRFPGLRKAFVADFRMLKETIPDMEEFFELLHSWLEMQKKIFTIDLKIAESSTNPDAE
jgi:hypothetical protein